MSNRWSERDLTSYVHPEYQFEARWTKSNRLAQFWFPVDKQNVPDQPEHQQNLLKAIGEPFSQTVVVSHLNPNFRSGTRPSEQNESGQRLVVIENTFDVRLGTQEHVQLANFYRSIGEGYLTYDQTFRRKVVNELGIRACQILSVYEPYMLQSVQSTTAAD